MLKAVMFDLDDTLLWDEKSVAEAFRATCEYAATRFDLDPQQLEVKVRSHAEQLYMSYKTYPFTKMIGTGTFEAFWADYTDEGQGFEALREIVPEYRKDAWFKGLQDLGIEDEAFAVELAERFPEERKQHVYLYDETIDVLNKLKGKYKLLMLTNGSSQLQHLKLSLSPELVPYFDHIVISGEFGEGKPSENIFKYALNLLEIDKREAVMIGDNPNTDILGANRSDIDSIWINHHNRTLEDITPTFEVKRLKEILPIIKSL
ncbi:MAG TPA: HAD family hydrolase [Pseudogracilibacillus sp.]|nr:HAD family hydrolase [Pseudogracilibacillus sp.]